MSNDKNNNNNNNDDDDDDDEGIQLTTADDPDGKPLSEFVDELDEKRVSKLLDEIAANPDLDLDEKMEELAAS